MARNQTPAPESKEVPANTAAIAQDFQAANQLAVVERQRQELLTQAEQEKDEVFAAGVDIGRLEAMDFVLTVSTAAILATFENAKKSKAWRHLKNPKSAHGEHFASLEEFCEVKLGNQQPPPLLMPPLRRPLVRPQLLMPPLRRPRVHLPLLMPPLRRPLVQPLLLMPPLRRSRVQPPLLMPPLRARRPPARAKPSLAASKATPSALIDIGAQGAINALSKQHRPPVRQAPRNHPGCHCRLGCPPLRRL